MKDYLIIGQGIAGSFVAWELLKRKKSTVMVDDSHKRSSSIISAGIVNPVTGKRFAVTERFNRFFSYARKSYDELEEKFGERFFESKPVLRIFQNESERDHWARKETFEEMAMYGCQSHAPGEFMPRLKDSLGSVMITQAGYCKSARLLAVFQEFFLRKKMLALQRFSYDDLKIEGNHVIFSGEKFRKVIFCEGYQAQSNPWFDWLPFNSVKGEILKITMDNTGLPDVIINKGKWCAPIGNSHFSAGATYIWNRLDCHPTEKARTEILEGLKKCFAQEISVLDHAAGVRPVMKDQTAVLGSHPRFPHLCIFNGLGSKGFLTAPVYAADFTRYLLGEKDLDKSISLNRFDFSLQRA